MHSAAGVEGGENHFFHEKPHGETNVPEGNLFDADFSSAFSGESKSQKQEEVVDLLNMGGGGAQNSQEVSNVTQGVNLLDMGAPEPSNLELLTGTADVPTGQNSTTQEANLMGGGFDLFGGSASSSGAQQDSSNQGKFDPFASNQSAAPAQPAKPPSSFDAFDLLGSTGTSNSGVSRSNNASPSTFQTQNQNKPTSAKDDFLSFMDKPSNTSLGGSKSTDNLMGFGGMNINNLTNKNNVTSPGFAGSGQPMGGFMGQQNKQAGFGTQPSPMQPKDPFADFGKTSLEIFRTCIPQTVDGFRNYESNLSLFSSKNVKFPLCSQAILEVRVNQ